MITIGYDLGSSAVKVTLFDVEKGISTDSISWPETEMSIAAPHPGWAEQDPDYWWELIVAATGRLKSRNPKLFPQIRAIGISYQMHGLVIVDKDLKALRPSIIWCDSRAADTGDRAFRELGQTFCLSHYLNSPGNFTAAKLRWVQEQEPETYGKISRIMLPGDYIAMKLTGKVQTTVSGLSEGILWDFKNNHLAIDLLEHWKIDPGLLAEQVDTFTPQATVSREASAATGLPEGTPVAYRSGDQPNNAFSLGILHPGEVAATAGTSGVIYGVSEQASYDPQSRVNTFVHVNHSPDLPRYGVLMCVNGTGILNSWMQKLLSTSHTCSYPEMNRLAAEAVPGSNGIRVYPFGNGAERILGNREPGVSIEGIFLNRHDHRDLLRASQEGIVFALTHGMHIMRHAGVEPENIRAGYANMFLSPVFREAFIHATGCSLELCNTDGAQGAARGAAFGAGLYPTLRDAFEGLEVLERRDPDPGLQQTYQNIYQDWAEKLP